MSPICLPVKSVGEVWLNQVIECYCVRQHCCFFIVWCLDGLSHLIFFIRFCIGILTEGNRFLLLTASHISSVQDRGRWQCSWNKKQLHVHVCNMNDHHEKSGNNLGQYKHVLQEKNLFAFSEITTWLQFDIEAILSDIFRLGTHQHYAQAAVVFI